MSGKDYLPSDLSYYLTQRRSSKSRLHQCQGGAGLCQAIECLLSFYYHMSALCYVSSNVRTPSYESSHLICQLEAHPVFGIGEHFHCFYSVDLHTCSQLWLFCCTFDFVHLTSCMCFFSFLQECLSSVVPKTGRQCSTVGYYIAKTPTTK